MAAQPVPAIRKFNPGLFQSDQEVRKQFVVRNHELGLLLDDLRSNISSPSCQHILVVGPRGRGKTMLLARVAAELRSNGEFAGSLLPVRFMEESQEILSFTDFWLETLFHLANLVARGAAPRDLLAVLSADTAKSASLRPLIVALHQRAGDRVRAPREVQEVAVDIRGRFREADERMGVVR